MKLGVRLESFGMPFRQALSAAAKLGVKGAQLDAIGNFHPDRLSETGRREVAFLCRSNGLDLVAIRCAIQGTLSDDHQLEARLDYARRVMMLSFDLGARMVIIDAGAIPEKEDDPKLKTLREAITELMSHGDRCGSAIALDIGAEPPERMSSFLSTLPAGLIGVNFNPANLLVRGHDPIAAINDLKPWIIHAQAEDARRGAASRSTQSIPLGGGDIEWMTMLGTLSANDFHGWLVVHTVDPDPANLDAGVKFLRRLI